jgi:hypothetical protein
MSTTCHCSTAWAPQHEGQQACLLTSHVLNQCSEASVDALGVLTDVTREPAGTARTGHRASWLRSCSAILACCPGVISSPVLLLNTVLWVHVLNDGLYKLLQ